MPICRSCLKGFNSDLNVCPHCEHDQSKKSFRTLLTLILIFGVSIFLYAVFFSKYSLTVSYNGTPKENLTVYLFMKPQQKTNKEGSLRLRKGFCFIKIPDGDEVLKWQFYLEADTTVNVNTKNRTLEISHTKYILLKESYSISFASLLKSQQAVNPQINNNLK